MSRDHRYDLIRSLYDRGKIVAFNDIFKYIPKTVVARDLGKKVDRFNKLISKVGGFTLDDLALIGKFCDLEDAIILELAIKEYTLQKKNKPPNTK